MALAGRWLGRALVVGLAFLVSLFGPAQVRVVEAVTFGSVSGTVRDVDGNGVAGLRVGIYAIGETTPFRTTDASGDYTIPVPTSSSPYDVQLLAPCTRDQVKRVVVDGAEIVDFTVAGVTVQAGYRCGATSFAYINGVTVAPLEGDDAIAGVRLPFGIPYFGAAPDSTITVSTNGFFTFGPLSDSHPRNTSMPQAEAPNAVVAPYWDDLNVDFQSRIETFSGGVSPNRFFGIEWDNVRIVATGQQVRFEAVLFENGRIVFNYLNLTPSEQLITKRGTSATVGIENHAGTAAVQRSFNQPYLDGNFAIEFVPVAPK